MSGRIIDAVIALCGVRLGSAVNGAGKSAPSNTPPQALAKARPAARHRAGVERGVFAEMAIIVCVVSLAAALGVASGLWINTGLASSPLEGTPSSAQPSSVVHATEQTAHALTTQTSDRPDDYNVPPQAAEESPGLTDTGEPPPASAKSKHSEETAANASGGTRADTATPTARDESRSAKASEVPGRTQGGEAKLTGGRGAGSVGRCTLSTDASALTIRGGGGSAIITLRLSGTTGPARITAATPNWSDVVVFAGAETSGSGASVGWYTVRSVSRRAGVYRVSFATPCGTKTIPVVVTP